MPPLVLGDPAAAGTLRSAMMHKLCYILPDLHPLHSSATQNTNTQILHLKKKLFHVKRNTNFSLRKHTSEDYQWKSEYRLGNILPFPLSWETSTKNYSVIISFFKYFWFSYQLTRNWREKMFPRDSFGHFFHCSCSQQSKYSLYIKVLGYGFQSHQSQAITPEPTFSHFTLWLWLLSLICTCWRNCFHTNQFWEHSTEVPYRNTNLSFLLLLPSLCIPYPL